MRGPAEPERGFAKLPAPDAGDLFFDFEGDPFVGEAGLEYLFGIGLVCADGGKHIGSFGSIVLVLIQQVVVAAVSVEYRLHCRISLTAAAH